MSLLPLLPGALALGLGLGLGLREKLLLSRHLDNFKYRVNVTGTRGKSTVVRLLTAAFLEDRIPVVAKTTGSEARILSFLVDKKKNLSPLEYEFKRPLEGPNIKELRSFISKARSIKATTLVVEDMTINSDYRDIFSQKFLKANVLVITNVLKDHMEVLGPTLDDVAEAYSAVIPEEGLLITTPGKYLPYFKKIAARKKTTVIISQETEVPPNYSGKFSYLLFPETLALALQAAVSLGISKETALKGMLNAVPDPGALQIKQILVSNGAASDENGRLVKAFAANDPTSALLVWKYFKNRGYLNKQTIVLMNCRQDRVERSEDFARLVLPKMSGQSLLIMGEITKPVVSMKKHFSFSEVLNLEGVSAKKIARLIREKYCHNNLLFGTGNYHGTAKELCLELEKIGGK